MRRGFQLNRADLARADKRLNVAFQTSSLEKFLQARIVFGRAGLLLRHFPSHIEPYNEEYELGSQELLSRALREVSNAVGGSQLFFVEDTSLRVEALSDISDYPGLRVKEWF